MVQKVNYQGKQIGLMAIWAIGYEGRVIHGTQAKAASLLYSSTWCQTSSQRTGVRQQTRRHSAAVLFTSALARYTRNF